jgi:transcription antitermination protein NusB
LALQGLCCLDVQGEKARQLVEDFLSDSREPAQTVAAARTMLQAAWGDRAACDELLARHARNWELSRLALVDRNILRLGACELREGKAPPKVVITEAIKLAQEFSTADSPRFVNGVLDAVAKEIRRDAGDGKKLRKEEETKEEEEEEKKKQE